MDPTQSYPENLRRYYRYHSFIYDLTRWSFLFGRKTLVQNLPPLKENPTIIEIGCGTGNNLLPLANRYPNAEIYGIDLSSDMLIKAAQKVHSQNNIYLQQRLFDNSYHRNQPADLILCSYSLTMMDKITNKKLIALEKNLKPEGYIAIVDFHTSPYTWFRDWMKRNNVDLKGKLLPLLQLHFSEYEANLKKAYLGLWNYFYFIGSK